MISIEVVTYLYIIFLVLGSFCIYYFLKHGEDAIKLSFEKFTGQKNMSYDIRGDPFPIPNVLVSPWNQSNIRPYPYAYLAPYTASYAYPYSGYLYNEYIPPNSMYLPYYDGHIYKPFSMFANNK